MKKAILKQILSVMILCGLLVLALPAADIVPFSDITPAQAAALIKEKGADPHFMILDVRTAREFAVNRIKGAVNYDFRAPGFKEKVEKLAKDGVYLAYCRGGLRSARAMNLMKNWGFKKVYNLAGGFMAWQKEKLPLIGTPLPEGPAAAGRKGKRKGR
jgi:phage shock protein E